MWLFDTAIRNHGAGSARDIRIVFEPNFIWPAGAIGGTGTVNEIEFFRDLPFLGPHDEILLFAGTRDWLNGRTCRRFGAARFTSLTTPALSRCPFVST